MYRRHVPLLLAGLAVFGLLAISAWYVLCGWKDAKRDRNMGRRYHPVAIQGFSGKIAGVGVEFDSLDVRKARSGGITFGGFNVLEMANLKLTIYPQGTKPESRTGTETPISLPYANMDNPVSVIGSFAAPDLKIASVKIRHVSVFKAAETADGNPALWIEAGELYNAGRQLRLKDACLCESGVRRALGDARLIVRDGYRIAYGKDFSQQIKLF